MVLYNSNKVCYVREAEIEIVALRVRNQITGADTKVLLMDDHVCAGSTVH